MDTETQPKKNIIDTPFLEDLKRYKTFAEFNCLYDPDDPSRDLDEIESTSMGIIFGCSLMLLLTFYLIWESYRKFDWIRKPIGNSHNQTYCYLSLSIL